MTARDLAYAGRSGMGGRGLANKKFADAQVVPTQSDVLRKLNKSGRVVSEIGLGGTIR